MLDFLKNLQAKNKGKGNGQGSTRPRKDPAAPASPSESGPAPQVRRKILVVGQDHTFSAGVMDYAANLAERLGYDLIVMNVNPAPEGTGKFFAGRGEKFAQKARAAWAVIAPEMAARGINCEQVVKSGGLAKAVSDLNQQIKRLDFVITDAGTEDEEITREIPLPVFSITGYQGEKVMAPELDSNKSRPWGKVAAYGAGAVALYAAVFANSGTVMNLFTQGGWYSALPIGTVFAVSFVHGAFAHHFWAALGIEAPRKATQPRPEVKRPVRRQRPRPQLRLDT
jgi:hypothetical protein